MRSTAMNILRLFLKFNFRGSSNSQVPFASLSLQSHMFLMKNTNLSIISIIFRVVASQPQVKSKSKDKNQFYNFPLKMVWLKEKQQIKFFFRFPLMRATYNKLMISPYKIKRFISIGIVLTLMLGIGLLYVLVYAFIASGITARIEEHFRSLFIVVFLAISVLMIFSSLCGIYGFMRKKNKCVAVYAVTMLVYFASFLVLTVFLFQYPSYLSQNCTAHTCEQYRAIVTAASNTLCRDECECTFLNYDRYSIYQREQIDRMKLNKTNELGFSVNTQNCSTWAMSEYPLTSQMLLLESMFNCSGWTQQSLYYLFTNINKGIPESTCAASLASFFQSFGLILQISCILVCLFLFSILVAVACLCLNPSRGREYDDLKFFKRVFTFLDEAEEEQI